MTTRDWLEATASRYAPLAFIFLPRRRSSVSSTAIMIGYPRGNNFINSTKLAVPRATGMVFKRVLGFNSGGIRRRVTSTSHYESPAP